jgi:hypothetical protein
LTWTVAAAISSGLTPANWSAAARLIGRPCWASSAAGFTPEPGPSGAGVDGRGLIPGISVSGVADRSGVEGPGWSSLARGGRSDRACRLSPLKAIASKTGSRHRARNPRPIIPPRNHGNLENNGRGFVRNVDRCPNDPEVFIGRAVCVTRTNSAGRVEKTLAALRAGS